MLCQSPITVRTGGHHKRMLVGCGQCIPCRINRRRIWVHRLMLEAALHQENAFATLTYSPDNLPTTLGPDGVTRPTLAPADLRNFLKRFRKTLEPARIRFFAAGEYGDESELPHYHLALFGYPPCPYGESRLRSGRRNCCPACDNLRTAWGLGITDLGTLTEASASYVAGYVLKKMTAGDDLRLLGRHPEFARMSNRPGIGADMMHDVASTLLSFNLENTEPDVPSALRHGSRLMPLGRYLQRKLRTYVGLEPGAPEVILQEREAEMQRLREAAFPVSKSLPQQHVEENQGKLNNLLGRHKLRKQRKSL